MLLVCFSISNGLGLGCGLFFGVAEVNVVFGNGKYGGAIMIGYNDMFLEPNFYGWIFLVNIQNHIKNKEYHKLIFEGEDCSVFHIIKGIHHMVIA